MQNDGVGSWPARRARSSPHRRAVVYGSAALTYGQLDERVRRLAHGLRELGLRRGDRVAFIGTNQPAFVETLFATTYLGAVFLPLNTRLAAPEVAYQLQHCDARVLVYAPTSAALVALLRAEIADVAVVAVDAPADGDVDYETLLAHAPTDPIDERVDRDDPAIVMYTSGTTGRPKGATLTHANIIYNCFNVIVDVDLTADEVTLISAPLFHVAALNQTLLPTFLKGGCSVLLPAWNVEACFDLIASQRITFMFGVSTMFAGLAQSPRWDGADLSSLRILMSGGAPIPVSLIRTYQERGLLFLQGYGLTETAPGATFLSAEMSEVKAGSAGVPCFFTDVRVVGPDGKDVATGETGEVLVHGPNVMRGYWGDDKATAAAFSGDRWFRSGDLATIDEAGYLFIVDRTKDMYISGGENVYPAEVEAALFQHPAVAECAIIGVPHEKWGEVGHAYVIRRPGAEVDGQALRDFLTERLAKYKVPASVEFVDDFPRTGSGKVQKEKLRRSAGVPEQAAQDLA
jgi:fatty-acyl-CoA synthase